MEHDPLDHLHEHNRHMTPCLGGGVDVNEAADVAESMKVRSDGFLPSWCGAGQMYSRSARRITRTLCGTSRVRRMSHLSQIGLRGMFATLLGSSLSSCMADGSHPHRTPHVSAYRRL